MVRINLRIMLDSPWLRVVEMGGSRGVACYPVNGRDNEGADQELRPTKRVNRARVVDVDAALD